MSVRGVVVAGALWALMVWPGVAAPVPDVCRQRIDEVWHLVSERFVDSHLHGVDWGAQRKLALAQEIRSDADCERVINDMLASLQTSHTHYYRPDDPMYYYLATTFGPKVAHFPPSLLVHRHVMMSDVGMFVQDGYVRAVLDGSPASVGGVRVGDRIVDVDGQPYRGLASWPQAGKAVRIRVQHTVQGSAEVLTVVPHSVEPQAALVDASRKSIRVFERDGRHIGYVHAWAFTNDDTQPLVHDALGTEFKGCDAVILDLRDGLGGGDMEFLLPWLQVPHLTLVPRQGEPSVYPPKPPRTIVLTNDGTRSGKELFAYAFKHFGLGTLVGARTAGAVTAGSPFYLSDGSLLYLAVAKMLVDGEDLEGRGVTPDVVVERPIPYCNGADPQLEAALRLGAGH